LFEDPHHIAHAEQNSLRLNQGDKGVGLGALQAQQRRPELDQGQCDQEQNRALHQKCQNGRPDTRDIRFAAPLPEFDQESDEGLRKSHIDKLKKERHLAYQNPDAEPLLIQIPDRQRHGDRGAAHFDKNH
jgi:hypothetical protein